MPEMDLSVKYGMNLDPLPAAACDARGPRWFRSASLSGFQTSAAAEVWGLGECLLLQNKGKPFPCKADEQ